MNVLGWMTNGKQVWRLETAGDGLRQATPTGYGAKVGSKKPLQKHAEDLLEAL